jgi:hypothetical protein
MDPQLVWVIGAIVLAVVVVGVWFYLRRQRTEKLRGRFGPEYDHTVKHTGSVAKAEAALEARARRVERFHIRPLSLEDATRFSDSWRQVQAQFVDDPKAAITEADRLVGELMQARGYPVGEFEQRVEDISVDHPNVVMHYRAARDIAADHERGKASTEDLRQAMVHYRALFNDLLETTPAQTPETASQPAEAIRGRR